MPGAQVRGPEREGTACYPVHPRVTSLRLVALWTTASHFSIAVDQIHGLCPTDFLHQEEPARGPGPAPACGPVAEGKTEAFWSPCLFIQGVGDRAPPNGLLRV